MAASRRPRRPRSLLQLVDLTKLSLTYLFLLTFFLVSASAAKASLAKSIHECTPGFLFCEYYGCQQLPMCPQVCEAIGDENLCNRSFDGTSCKWERGVCARDVQCENSNGTCSSDCMHCNTFGCVPKASQCPQACALYSLQEQCKSAPKIGSISCDWSGNRCQTVDEKATPTKPTKPTTSLTPSSLPTFNPEADPDFGNIYSKRAWAGTVGIIVGVIFGLLGLLGIIFLVWHRLRERRRRLNSDAALHFTHTTMYRPQSFIRKLRSVVDHNARELDAVAPLSPLPPAQRSNQ